MRHRLPIVVAVALLAAPSTAVALTNGPTETTTTSDGGARGGTATTPDPTTTDAAPAPDPAPAVPDTPTTETSPTPPAVPPTTTTNRPSAPADPGAAVDPTRLEPDRPATRQDGTDERKRRADRPADGDRRSAADRRKRDRERSGAKAGEPKPETPEEAAQALLDAPATGLSALSVERFRIPPFLLPIYQAAGVQYGIRWEILAAINEIETDYGRNLSVSTAGALGWMQFMPATWAQYGVDATGDDSKDPYNPVDAIFAAARYLKAAGGETDVRKAIFAYNHADWYVEDVLRRAASIASLPADVIASLTGLTLAQLPVYVAPDADEPAADDAASKARDRVVVADGPDEQWAEVRGPADAPVVAVQDGTVTRRGTSPKLGRFVEIRDAYGNRYTYAGLGTLASEHLVPRRSGDGKDEHEHERETAHAPAEPPAAAADLSASSPGVGPARPRVTTEPGGPIAPPAPVTGSAITTSPAAPTATTPAEVDFGTTLTAPVVRALARLRQVAADASADSTPTPAATTRAIGEIDDYLVRAGSLRRSDVRLRALRVGSKVLAGTVLGRMAADDGQQRTRTDATNDGSPGSTGARAGRSTIRFAIRPAGDGAPRIDPRPIVEGWRLLDDAAVFGHPDDSALVADRGDEPDVGRLLLMSKDQLQRRVLANPSLEIYPAGLADIRAGAIDRRVLATMEYLTANGLKLAISSLKSGHSILSASGNVSAHSYGSAMDIAVVDGTPILGHQGAGSITDRTIRLLLRLQGTSRPNQIISLMTYPGTDNTLAMADHADHIHVGFPRAAGAGTVTLGRQVAAVLAPGQWDELVTRLGRIENPKVRRSVSAAATPAKPRTTPADAKRR